MKKVTKSLAIYLVPIILIAFFVTMTQNNTLSTKYFTVNEMIVNVKKDNVKEIVAKGNDIAKLLLLKCTCLRKCGKYFIIII